MIILFVLFTIASDITVADKSDETTTVNKAALTIAYDKSFRDAAQVPKSHVKLRKNPLQEFLQLENSTIALFDKAAIEEAAIIKRSPSFGLEQDISQSEVPSYLFDDNSKKLTEHDIQLKSVDKVYAVDEESSHSKTDASDTKISNALTKIVDILSSTDDTSRTVENSNSESIDDASTDKSEGESFNITEDIEGKHSTELENETPYENVNISLVSRHGNYENEGSEEIVRFAGPDVMQSFFPNYRIMLGAEQRYRKGIGNAPSELYGGLKPKLHYENFRDLGSHKTNYGGDTVYPTSELLRYNPTNYKNPQESALYYKTPRNYLPELPRDQDLENNQHSNAYPYTPLSGHLSTERVAWYPENVESAKSYVPKGYYEYKGYEQSYSPFSYQRYGHRHRRNIASTYL